MDAIKACSSKRKQQQDEDDEVSPKRKCFRFNDKMVAELIQCLLDFKVICEYSGIDFDADKSSQYKHLRTEMAKLYVDEDETYFGAVESTILVSELLTKEAKQIEKENKKIVDRGYKRILEKVKDIRQKFSKALLAGTRSGSGKFIYEHYDKLVQLWGGCPNTEPNPTGVDSSQLMSTLMENDEFESYTSLIDSSPPQSSLSEESYSENGSQDVVTKLVDDKRKHLQRNLSASQRESLMLKEAREDREVQKQLQESLEASNASMANAMQDISKSMLQISNTIAKSFEFLINGNSSSNNT